MAAAAKAEAVRLGERADSWARDGRRLKDWIQKLLEYTKLEKSIKGILFIVSPRKRPPIVRFLNEHDVPLWFWREVPPVPASKAIDKAGILAAFAKGGESPPGVDIVRNVKLKIG